jgi:hypothetical protein
MTITYRGAVVRNIKSNSYYGYDIDATNYIRSVESADGQTLETGVKDAINAFVVGCKSDGIWDAIKASCIMAGARTLDGALVPLVGPEPTNYNFVNGDYSRKLGLVGDDATKVLDSNRANNADPKDNNHNAVYMPEQTTTTATVKFIGSLYTQGFTAITRYMNGIVYVYNRYQPDVNAGTYSTTLPFLGTSRSSSASFTYRVRGSTIAVTATSQTPTSDNILLKTGVNGRLSFYSIGEALDLALLDTRVTSLMAQLAFAINTGLSPIGYSSETINYVNAGYAAGGSLA